VEGNVGGMVRSYVQGVRLAVKGKERLGGTESTLFHRGSQRSQRERCIRSHSAAIALNSGTWRDSSACSARSAVNCKEFRRATSLVQVMPEEYG
jgi:hypothetical protein